MIIGPAEYEGEDMVFHRKMIFEPKEGKGVLPEEAKQIPWEDGQKMPEELMRITHDGEVIVAAETHLFVITIPQPTVPELTEEIKGSLDLVKMAIEMNIGSMAIVPLDEEVADRVFRLYDFDKVAPAMYSQMALWQTEMMPGCMLVQYVARTYIVSLPHLVYEGGGREVMNLLRDSSQEKPENGEITS